MKNSSDKAKSKNEQQTLLKTEVSTPKQNHPSYSGEHDSAKLQELTRIDQFVRGNDLSAGFIEAKKAADQALEGDKIVLNKRFVLKSTLGSGGMGTVYKAQDLRKVEASDLNPYVAVKVLNDNFRTHPDAFVSLQREASRSHTLSHPNIVTVHDFDRDGDIFYMTMELLKGKGLEEVLKRVKGRGLPANKAIPIIKDYCRGLIYAHKKNIVHSDLKPGNLFVSQGGTKVLDFGIARITNQAAVQNDFDAGSLGALTPAYASLEMIQGEEPHPSDDVYAAAIIAYELFSGTHPYDRTPADKALEKKLKPTRLNNLTSRQWNTLNSALQIKRNNRTQNLEEFINGLTQVKKFPIYKVSSALLLSCVLVFAYFWLNNSDELIKQANNSYQKAELCFKEKNYSCSLDGAKAVLEMLPNHKQAQKLRSESEHWLKTSELLSKIKECIHLNRNLACANKSLNELKQHSPSSPKIGIAHAAIESFTKELNLATHIDASQKCYTKANYNCAKKEAEKALLLSPNNTDANRLLKDSNRQIALFRIQDQKTTATFHHQIEKGNGCLSKKDYDCAINAFKKAKNAKPNNERAKTLLQQAIFGKNQYQESLSIVSNMLKKGEKCFTNKNFSCSIASADSALAIIHDHTKAIQLRSRAKKAISDLKKQILIE